jgi:hypothetical protein
MTRDMSREEEQYWDSYESKMLLEEFTVPTLDYQQSDFQYGEGDFVDFENEIGALGGTDDGE